MRLTKRDIIAIVITIVFIILLSIPNFIDKSNCEVARPMYKCETIINVLKENCDYLETNNFTDQGIVWYVEQLCPLQNKYHDSSLDCSNVENVCKMV